MRLGIDFGTTRIVVAAVDRGNYPVVTFEDQDGVARDWFPPLIAVKNGKRLYGWDAWAAQSDPGVTLIRSIKRFLEDAGPCTLVEIGGQTVPMECLLEEMVASLKHALLETSSIPGNRTGPIEIMLGVPANANSNQRFLTVEPFQRAGFHVLGLLNEPSAASIEYGHSGTQPSDRVVVYDLGGGTFDVSLVEIEDRMHSVVASEGVRTLGGDDFDIILSELALETSGVTEELTQAEMFRLHEECRLKKEALHPNTRKIVIDLGNVREGWDEVSVPAPDYYERCRPLVEKTLDVTRQLLAAYESTRKLEAVYVTGGGSELPLVARVLKEEYGRKVKRSAYTRSATAIGLAIQADAQTKYVLREQFTRHFGVWREAEAGKVMIFDPLFPKATELPALDGTALTITRTYCPVHNVGHFRYLECSQRSEDGRPSGDITVWDEIRFPFDPALAAEEDLSPVPVAHTTSAVEQEIEERYSCQPSGAVAVRITNLTAGYTREYRLGRWAGKDQPITPGKRKAAKR